MQNFYTSITRQKGLCNFNNTKLDIRLPVSTRNTLNISLMMQLLLPKRLSKEQGINKNKAISNHRYTLTLGCSDSISNSTLNRREHRTTTNTHNEHGRTLLGIGTEILDREREDRRIHAGLEEEDGDEEDDGGNAAKANCQSAEEGGEECPDCEDVSRFEEFHETGGNEAANGEGCKGDGEEIGGEGVGDVFICFRNVVDEERSKGDLGCDVDELGDETEDCMVLLVEWSLGDFGVTASDRLLKHEFVADFRDMYKEESDCDTCNCDSNSKIDELDRVERVDVGTGKEGIGSDQRTNEGTDTVKRLRKVESERSGFRITENGNVWIGRCFEFR